jgi:hypothetical protein
LPPGRTPAARQFAERKTYPRTNAEDAGAGEPESHFRVPLPEPHPAIPSVEFDAGFLQRGFYREEIPGLHFLGHSSNRSALLIDPGESPHFPASFSADQRKSARAARI